MLGPHLGASVLPFRQLARVQPPGAEDHLASYLTGLELFKEGTESAQFTPVGTGNNNSPWGRQPWQTSKHLTWVLAGATDRWEVICSAAFRS